MKPVFDKSGLLTTVVCDARTNKSYALTKKTHQTWFWSRSRQKLWHKGEESGNTQEVVSMTLDCDFDTLLVSVIPAGPACHTGHETCFFNEVEMEE